MSLLLLPNETLSCILQYITDKPALATLALTSKGLNNIVSYHLYRICPVSEDAIANCAMPMLDEKVDHLRESLSPRNARYIEHIVLGPASRMDDAKLTSFMKLCVQLRRATIYLVHGAAHYEISKVQQSPLTAVDTLTMRFVPHDRYDPENWMDQRNHNSDLRGLEFDLLRNFTSITSLGVITHCIVSLPSEELFRSISDATSHLKISVLTTNQTPNDPATGVFHPYGLTPLLFPALKNICYSGQSPAFNVSSLSREPSHYRGRPFSVRAVVELIKLAAEHGWRFSLNGMTVVLYSERGERCDAEKAAKLTLIYDWIRKAGADRMLVHAGVGDLLPNLDSLLLQWGHPEIYLNIRCCVRFEGNGVGDIFAVASYSPQQQYGFITKIVPSMRSLYVSSFLSSRKITCNCNLNEYQSEGLFELFDIVVDRTEDFKLSHIQNLPPLENEICPFPPLEIDKPWFLDARVFQPLSQLPSLTSIELDFKYLERGTSR